MIPSSKTVLLNLGIVALVGQPSASGVLANVLKTPVIERFIFNGKVGCSLSDAKVSSCYKCYSEANKNSSLSCQVKRNATEACPDWANTACITSYNTSQYIYAKSCASVVGPSPISMGCSGNPKTCYCDCRPNCNVGTDPGVPVPAPGLCPPVPMSTAVPNESQVLTAASVFRTFSIIAFPTILRGYNKATNQEFDSKA